MQHRNWILSLAAIACLIASPFSISAQQQPAASGGQQVIAVTTERPLAELLPDKLAGAKATNELKQYNADNLAELVGDLATIYREYYVTRAVSRQYGPVRIDIFESSHPFGAFGLVMFYGHLSAPLPTQPSMEGGSRGKYFVRVTTPNGELHSFYKVIPSPPDASIFKPVRAVFEKLTDTKPDERPVIMHSLPEASRASSSAGYYLGPESLNMAVPGTRDLYAFNGDAEAVVAEYKINKPAADANNSATKPNAIKLGAAPTAAPMKLVIVEYHTPQFAYDAIARANEYVNALPEADRQRVIIKREGNYIVQAVNFDDRDAAQAIVDAVQYPYGVQWLHHPSIPSPDPFRAQKAAEMLLSTFGLLGLMIGSVVLVGSIFGTTMFLKRRKRMQEVFSDAGDMLRLEINPFEEAMLGLPPKRE